MKRNLAPIRALVRELIPIVGSFAPNGSSAVAASSRKGLGWSVARTSAGLFTVTLSDTFADVISIEASIQHVTARDVYAQVGTLINTTTPVIQIRVMDISGAAVDDLVADANTRIHFVFWCRNSAAKPTYGA